MKIELKIDSNKKETKNGLPLVLVISHQGKRKQKIIAYCKESHFIYDGAMISGKHPDYDVLAPILMEIKIRARKLILNGCSDVNRAYDDLFAVDFTQIGFIEFADKLVFEMFDLAEKVGKTDLRSKNRMLGNANCYKSVVEQFRVFGQNVSLQNLDYQVLMRFRTYKMGVGNSKATIHMYLRTLRAIYNKGILLYKFPDEKPFKKIFDGLKTRSYDSRKKYLTKESIVLLENLDLKTAKQKYVDLFLLQFYFAGADLIDLYYLKNKQIKFGRLIFERTKTDNGNRIDLKIHDKAKLLLDKFEPDGEWLFNFKKDKTSYLTFRRTYQSALIYVLEKENIKIMPNDVKIGSKVARHTFATLAKNLFIREDVIRELMGHERDDVDNYYKDSYSAEVRDKALFDVIG